MHPTTERSRRQRAFLSESSMENQIDLLLLRTEHQHITIQLEHVCLLNIDLTSQTQLEMEMEMLRKQNSQRLIP